MVLLHGFLMISHVFVVIVTHKNNSSSLNVYQYVFCNLTKCEMLLKRKYRLCMKGTHYSSIHGCFCGDLPLVSATDVTSHL